MRDKFDIFFSYNGDDNAEVLQLAKLLENHGVKAWMYELHQNSHEPFVQQIERAISEIASAGILVGRHGMSKFVRMEYNACVQRCANDEMRMFGILLPGAGNNPQLPPFLMAIPWVDLRDGITSTNVESFVREILDAQNADDDLPDDPGPSGEPESPLPGEWMVREAKEHAEFLAAIHALHTIIRRNPLVAPDTELVMTLYARRSSESGVGTFEYDLLYYRNILDDSPMFGPTVKDDDRTKFIETAPFGHEISMVKEQGKPGGFIERERIHSFAKFKLAQGFWEASEPWKTKFGQAQTHVGLLFINGRDGQLRRDVLETPQVAALLARLTVLTSAISTIRSQRYRERRGLILDIRAHMPTEKTISPMSTNSFFRHLETKLADVTEIKAARQNNDEKENRGVVLSAYLCHDEDTGLRRSLKWVWSNSPTSTPATLRLPSSRSESKLLISDVALDPNNKPLLIHSLQSKEKFRDKAVRTKLADASVAVLVVPIWSNAKARMVGVVEIQSSDAHQFDTDDVQLMYSLSSNCLAEVFELLRAFNDSGRLPLRNTDAYAPFEKQAPDFKVHDLLALNFNPMKYLLHWDKIRELITTNTTSAPATVEVWPNMICDHKCTWCRTELDRKQQNKGNNKREMTPKELRAIARAVRKLGKVDVLISGGGEPLLHPAIHKFMELIADIDGTVGIFTNGRRPRDFRFWEHFFQRADRHRFARVSFNGHSPDSYFRVHFDKMNATRLRPDHHEKYAEARKIILDLLGMRNKKSSVAIGDTVQYHDLACVREKAEHADRLGVDFIQMRPELWESSNKPQKGIDICTAVKDVAKNYAAREDYCVVHTDAERSFMEHTETRCYAMQLVPTLVPDMEQGWTRVMPCSYAINAWGRVPNLGRMKEGANLNKFWEQMNLKLTGGNSQDPDYEITISEPINPKNGCPQCRYFRLNQRIQKLADHKDKLGLIDQFVGALTKDPQNLDQNLCDRVNAVWSDNTPDAVEAVNIKSAQQVFENSRELGIVPPL